ncbi:MAG: NTP transferase domain-containing protein [Deltaproteobacteria bacterium]|nr:NTP transferase domain-containing protein [Deltaproteobacteria bacterium]
MLESDLRTSRSIPTDDDSPHLDWALALAGGDGVRLLDYVEQRFGQRMPKQYCCLLGKQSMLEHTLARLNELTPPARTLTVIGTHHAAMAAPQVAGRSDHVFRQPMSRDTGVAIYVALAMIKRWTPNAIVTITPTDHYVAPAHAYVQVLRQARGVAARMRDSVVVLGARPTEPDPELGYLSLGVQRCQIPVAHELNGFVEKPTVSLARDLIREGALWNTMVTCASVDALWELGRETAPQLLEVLDALVPLIGSPDEADAIDYVYRSQPSISFSRDIVECAPERLVAIGLDGVEWSDWGRPERIETTLALRWHQATKATAPEHAAPRPTSPLYTPAP